MNYLCSSAVLGAPTTITLNYSGNITYLEHTVLTATVATDALGARGDMQLELTSPSGTTSTILIYRSQDDTTSASYHNWPFMSVHYWGENPFGQWTLVLTLRGEGTATITGIVMTLYGTLEIPEVVSRIPESCDMACDPSRGCANAGPEFCDACAALRHADTLECIDECPSGFSVRNGYCYNSSLPEPVCNRNISGENLWIPKITVETLEGLGKVFALQDCVWNDSCNVEGD